MNDKLEICKKVAGKGFKKLYLVELKGLSSWQKPDTNTSYVIAYDTKEAYDKVKECFDKRDYGFSHERELKSITLLAEEYWNTDCDHILFINV